MMSRDVEHVRGTASNTLKDVAREQRARALVTKESTVPRRMKNEILGTPAEKTPKEMIEQVDKTPLGSGYRVSKIWSVGVF